MTAPVLAAVAVALAALACLWVVLALLAGRLPPGLARDLVGFVPDCVTALRRLRRDPRVPRSAKVAIVVAAVWAVSPIDPIPEFIPVIGTLDDVVVVVLALRWAATRAPRQAVLDAWPGDRRVIERVLGSP